MKQSCESQNHKTKKNSKFYSGVQSATPYIMSQPIGNLWFNECIDVIREDDRTQLKLTF